MNPAHIITPYLSKIHFTIIHPSMPSSPKLSPSFMFSDKILYTSQLLNACCICCPSQPPLIDNPDNIWWVHEVVVIKLTAHFVAKKDILYPRHQFFYYTKVNMWCKSWEWSNILTLLTALEVAESDILLLRKSKKVGGGGM
jgi:hypothetical protein